MATAADTHVHRLLTVEEQLRDYGGSFEANYFIVCRVSSKAAGTAPKLSLCALGAGGFGAVLVAVHKHAPLFSKKAVAAKLAFAPRSPRAYPKDAATLFLREFFEPWVRLQHDEDAAGGITETQPEHPGITPVLDCVVEEVPTRADQVRLTIVSELAAISADMCELTAVEVDDSLQAFARPMEAHATPATAFYLLDLAAATYAGVAAGAMLLDPAFGSKARDLYFRGRASAYSCCLLSHVSFPPPLHRHAAKAVALQVLLALRYMHERRMYYRDMKPDNIVVIDTVRLPVTGGSSISVPVVRLIDFGIARPLESCSSPTSVGTVEGSSGYAPPEMMSLSPRGAVFEGQEYDGRVDSFCTGCTIFTLMAGVVIPEDRQAVSFPGRFKRLDGYVRSGNGTITGPVDALETNFPSTTGHARAWLAGATDGDPARRLTVDELIMHPWLADARAILPDAMKTAGLPFDHDGLAAAEASAAGIAARRVGGALPLEPVAAATLAHLERLGMHAAARRAARGY